VIDLYLVPVVVVHHHHHHHPLCHRALAVEPGNKEALLALARLDMHEPMHQLQQAAAGGVKKEPGEGENGGHFDLARQFDRVIG
jgi:hypothetical protein